MRILATGGAGYVGSATVRHLLAQGHEVTVYDNLSKGFAAAVPGEVLIRGDVADRPALSAVLRERQIEAVIHFAAFIAVGESTEKPDAYYRNNVANSLTLLEAMHETGVARLLFSSTAAVYAPAEQPLDEDAPKDPDSPYAFSKYAIERMIGHFSAAFGLGFTILRYFNVCGASADGAYGEAHSPETHLIPLVLQVPLGRREAIGIFGKDYDTPDGTCIRDYIHVDDLADAHARAVAALEPGAGSVFNVGVGRGYSVLEVIRAAEAVVGSPIPVRHLPRRPGDTSRLVAAAERLRERLGWRPRYEDLQEIIASAWRWHSRHPDGYSSAVGG